MGMNETPSSERVHIAFFGRRNAGKSSLVNAVTGQNMSVVSETKGTTTDPVRKSMELLPIGPVVIIDTPGFDDRGKLGEMRVKRTKEVLNEADAAVLVADSREALQESDLMLLQIFQEKQVPFLIAANKSDLRKEEEPLFQGSLPAMYQKQVIFVSALKREGIHALKEEIGKLKPECSGGQVLAGDLVEPGDFVLLVIPIDKAAPKGRLILPQQQVIRDLLEHRAIPIAAGVDEIECVLASLRKPPRLVITDSQAFAEVSRIVPESIALTSFSIIFARYKGILEQTVRGAAALAHLKEEDLVLISEGCTHHRQCGDIGTQKLPALLARFTGHPVKFETSQGKGFPEEALKKYRLVIHCGGCMLGEREVQSRMHAAKRQEIPMTNFGVAIAHMNGILKRSLAVFPEIQRILSET